MEDMSELPLLTIVVNSPNKALPSLNALKRQTGRYVGNGWRKTFEEAVAAYKRALPWSVQKQFPLAKATVLYTYYHRGIVQDQDNPGTAGRPRGRQAIGAAPSSPRSRAGAGAERTDASAGGGGLGGMAGRSLQRGRRGMR
jgi:hypothetical protein